ncbi:MAG: hypothetical protein JXD23_02370 [Spirochaetales bacterium]|nr:hypothetical protein [Spirochaetales bacterium]
MPVNITDFDVADFLNELYNPDQKQSISYYLGNGLGWLPEDIVTQLLFKAKVGDVQGIAPGPFYQRFEKISYSMNAGNFLVSDVIGEEYGIQGRFEISLGPSADTTYEITVTVYFKLDIKPGVTHTAEQIINNANIAINEYWGSPPVFSQSTFQLVSRIDGMVIPVRFKIQNTETAAFAFTVTVFPDTTPVAAMLPGGEVVQMSDFTWNMREMLTFSPFQDGAEAGRGPHEYGHMMGIPHDIGNSFTVMSTQAGTNSWKYFRQDGSADANSCANPWSSHFKLIKVWAENIFANKLNRVEDFIIKSPYE